MESVILTYASLSSYFLPSLLIFYYTLVSAEIQQVILLNRALYHSPRLKTTSVIPQTSGVSSIGSQALFLMVGFVDLL